MEKYKCNICGKTHPVYQGLDSPFPEVISEMSAAERKRRVVEADQFFIVDKEWIFCNGHILIALEGLAEPIFDWQVWAKVDKADFQDKLNQLAKREAVVLSGKLETDLPFYTKFKGLKVKISVPSKNEFGMIFQVEEESQLQEDQARPITNARVIELMQHLHHPERFAEMEKFDRSFLDRLTDELLEVEKKYVKRARNFVVNISKPGLVLFQLISSSMLSANEGKGRGFGLHLAFDDTDEECLAELKRFEQQAYVKDFDCFNFDGIPTAQIDFGRDIDSLIKMVNQIILDVYEEEVETIIVDSFEI